MTSLIRFHNLTIIVYLTIVQIVQFYFLESPTCLEELEGCMVARKQYISIMISKVQAKTLLHKYFDLAAVGMKELYGFENQIFIVKAKQSNKHCKPRRYTCKIIRDQGNERKVFQQVAAIQHTLYNRGFQVSCPELTLQNKLLQTFKQDREGKNERYILMLLKYLEGDLLSEIEVSQTQLNHIAHDCGTKLAKLDQELQKIVLEINLERRNFKWNISQSDYCRSCLPYIHDMELRDNISSIIEKFNLAISKNSNQLRKSLIHGDVNEANVIVEPSINYDDNSSYDDIRWNVKGFIDFNDMQYNMLVFDVAIFIAYMMNKAMLSNLNHIEAARYALAGYVSVAPLNQAETAVLYWCILKRMAVSVCAASEEVQHSGQEQMIKDLNSISNLLTLTCNMGEEEAMQEWKRK